jgi:hypothetical protein
VDQLHPWHKEKQPTQKELELLGAKYTQYNGWRFSLAQTLEPASLEIKQYNAVISARRFALENSPPPRDGNPLFAAAIFIKYNVKGVNPDRAHVHWIQFVERTDKSLFVDAGERTPYYDTGGTANSTGFFDWPFVPYPTLKANGGWQWSADLFIAQETGKKQVCIWQGLSYGFSVI